MSKFWNYFDDVKITNQLDIGQGNTPLTLECINEIDVAIKNEYSNPNMSFKDRGLAYQLSKHVEEGKTRFALSSSGNAAISAASLAVKYSIELELFLANKVNPKKLDEIKRLTNSSNNVHVNLSDRPRSDLIKYVNTNKDVTNLRGSTDPFAITGYKTISYEIVEQYPQIDAIFIPCSSGTSTLGIAEGFSELNKSVAINICQTTKVSPIAKTFDTSYLTSENSLGDAITDKIAHRKKSVIELIQKSQGSGWVISDDELLNAQNLANNWNFKLLTFNSLLSLAGLLKSIEKGHNYNYPVLLFSGL